MQNALAGEPSQRPDQWERYHHVCRDLGNKPEKKEGCEKAWVQEDNVVRKLSGQGGGNEQEGECESHFAKPKNACGFAKVGGGGEKRGDSHSGERASCVERSRGVQRGGGRGVYKRSGGSGHTPMVKEKKSHIENGNGVDTRESRQRFGP